MTGTIERHATGREPGVWPAERFYWSVLDAPAGTRIRPGPLPIGLRPAFEEDVPETSNDVVDVEGHGTGRRLHAVCTSIGRSRLVICAAQISDLKALDPATHALCPAEVPKFVRDELAASYDSPGGHQPDAASIAASLNLLVGELEPACFTAARARRRTVALLAALLCLGLTAIGLHRRAGNDAALAHAAAAHADDAARDLGRRLHAPVRVTPDTLPALLAVARRSADAATRIGVPTDASVALTALMEHWPRSGEMPASNGDGLPPPAPWSCSVQSLAVSGDSIAITVIIDGDAAAFLRALRPPPGWTVEEPRLTSVGRTAARDRKAKDVPSEPPASPVALTRIAVTLNRSLASSNDSASSTETTGAPQ